MVGDYLAAPLRKTEGNRKHRPTMSTLNNKMYATVSSERDANNYGLLPVSNNDKPTNSSDWSRLALVVGLIQVILLGLFLRFVQYPTSFSSQDDVQYVFYLNVTIMMLVGFGFLMTFQVSVIYISKIQK